MPAPLDVDREAVRTLVVAVGVREAARQLQIQEGTVCAWSKRFGWLRNTKATQNPPASIAPTSASSVIKPSQAMENVMNSRKAKSRFLLSSYVLNASKVASRSRKPLEDAQAVRHVAAVHAAIWPEQQTAGLTLNLLNVGGGMQ